MPDTLPLKPIDVETTKIEEVVEGRPKLQQVVRDVSGKGLRNVYFVGAGGSLICSFPALYLLQQKSMVPSFQVQSDELNCSVPALMGPGSLVVLASYTGKTKETVQAAKTASSTGATVIAAAKAGSPLAEAVDIAFAGKSDVFELAVAYAILEENGELDDAAGVSNALKALPSALSSAVEESDALLAEVAHDFKDDSLTYVLGSGPSSAWAYGLAMCFLQEMQWKDAASFNTGEFFQGAFEVIDDESAVILWLGEDKSRPMGERGKRFLETYCKRAKYIDVADLSLPGVPPNLRADVSPIVIGALASRLAQHYESVRGHDLDQRHYMFKVDY